MKKVLACLMVVCALLAFGCSGRNAAFGVVDIKKVEAEAPAVKNIKEDLQKKAKELKRSCRINPRRCRWLLRRRSLN